MKGDRAHYTNGSSPIKEKSSPMEQNGSSAFPPRSPAETKPLVKTSSTDNSSKGKFSKTTFTPKPPFTCLSDPSSPTKTPRACTSTSTISRNETHRTVIGERKIFTSRSAQSSPRRNRLLRQTALENSKESLTGDEKGTTSSSSSFAIIAMRAARGREIAIKCPNREPRRSEATKEKHLLGHGANPRNTNGTSSKGSQNNDDKNWLNNNNTYGSKCSATRSSESKGQNGQRELHGLKDDLLRDYLQTKSNAKKCQSKPVSSKYSKDTVSYSTCSSNSTKKTQSTRDRRGTENANTSCQSPSPPSSPKSVPIRLSSFLQSASSLSSPPTAVKLKSLSESQKTCPSTSKSISASTGPAISSVQLSHENGLSDCKAACSKSIETQQHHHRSANLTSTSQQRLPKDALIPEASEQRHTRKSISREPTLIGIRTIREQDGHGRIRDKIQLDTRLQQRDRRLEIKKLASSSRVNCKNKSKMSDDSSSIPLSSGEKRQYEMSSSPGKSVVDSAGSYSGTSITTSSFGPSSSTPKRQNGQAAITNGIVRRILSKMENGFGPHEDVKSEKESQPVRFIEPLPSSLEVLEGSEVFLSVKIEGVKSVVWVKNDKIVPHSPPDFEYKSNPVDGTYSLRIQDSFVEDSGLYICEAYGNEEDSDAVCWCHVKVVEEFEDDTSIELEEIPEDHEVSGKVHNFIVPVIITSQASPEPVMDSDGTENGLCTASEKRLEFSTCRDASWESSREVYEDALESCEEGEHTDLDMETANGPHNEIEILRDFKPNDSVLSEADVTTVEQSVIEDFHVAKEEPLGRSGVLDQSESDGESCECELVTEKEAIESPYTSGSPIQNSRQDPESTSTEFEGKQTSQTDPKVSEIGSTHHNPETDVEELREIILHEEEISIMKEKGLPEYHDNQESQQPEVMELPKISEKEILPNARDEISHDTHSPCNRSYSSQSSRESFGVVGGGGSDTFRSPSFEEATPSPNEDAKSVGTSVSGSSLRDSFSISDPRILMGPGNLIIMLGETVNLRVKVQTSDIAGTTVSWCKLVGGKYRRLGTNKSESASSEVKPHIQICKTNNDTSDLITLRINEANYEDSGKYRVKAQNEMGADHHQCILSVEGPPEPPSTPPNVIYDEKAHSVLVSWSSCPYDGGSAVTGYVLDALIEPVDGTNCNSEATWVTLTPTSFQRLCYTLKNPRSAFSYRFRVCVENAYGKGKCSAPSEALVVPEFSGSLVAMDKSLMEDERRKKSLSKDLSDEEAVYEYKDVRLKHESFHDYYEKYEQLGKGRFGVVFKVTNKESQNSYAGKFVKCIKGKDKERTQLEFQIMNQLKYHPKLICLVDAFEMPREIVIVTEMINGGELFERVVADDFTLTEHDCIQFLRQICDGVDYIHEKNIMHLDLKPENILCTTKTSNQIKIIDFGLAQHYNPKEPIRVLFGTAEFVSPEIISYDTICPATDMWSVGVITYILLSGLSPFLGDNDNETFSNITRGDFDFDDEAFDQVSEDAKEFISCLILKRKEDRLAARECLDHKWLALSDEEKKDIVLPTDKLKRFLLRRKWQKTGHAIRAIGRITTLYSSRRSSGSSTSSSPLGGLSLHRSLSAQDSVDDSVFGSVDIPDPQLNSNYSHLESPTHHQLKAVLEETNNSTNKPKYNDSSRSDSGICDVASTSTSHQ